MPISKKEFNQPRQSRQLLLIAGVVPALLAFYLIVTSGWNLIPGMDFYDAKRVLQIAIIEFTLIFALLCRPLRAQTIALIGQVPAFVRLPIALVFGFGLASALASQNVFYGLTEVSLYFSLCMLVFVTAASAGMLGARMLTLMAVFLLVLGSLVSITEIIGLVVHWNFGQPATSHTLFLRFSHPRFFNQLQSWLLPLMILPMLAFTGRPFMRGVATFNLIFWWALLFYSGGRGSMLGLFCAYGFVFLLLIKNQQFSRWRNFQLLALLSGIAVYMAVIFIPQFLGTDTGTAIAGSVGRAAANSSGRINYWRDFLQLLAERPLLGIGPGSAPCGDTMSYFAHPHNFYLQLAVEWGVVAGMAAATVILFVIRSVILRLRAVSPRPVSIETIVVATGVLAAATHAIFSGVMVMPASQVCGVLVFAYLTALLLKPAADLPARASGDQFTATKTLWTPAIALLVALALAQLTYFVVRELPLIEARANTFVEEHARFPSPRLWQNGHVCIYPGNSP
jgi:O-antigen ligase